MQRVSRLLEGIIAMGTGGRIDDEDTKFGDDEK